MIKELFIKDYLVIEKVLLEFGESLNIITGETGAGKSIIIGAIDIATGGKAETSIIRKGCETATISAVFDLSNPIKTVLEDNEIDYDDELIIKRVIKQNGKSVAYINEQRVNSGFIKKLRPYLFEIVSQFANSSLKDEKFQLELVDSLGDYDDLLEKVKEAYIQYRSIVNELDSLKKRINEVAKQRDYLLFQKQELEQLDLENLNIEDIEAEIELLKSNQKFVDSASQLSEILNGDVNIYSLSSKLEKLVSVLPVKDKDGKLEQIEGFISVLNDLESEFDSIISMDPNEVLEKLDFLQSKYFKFLDISKKYGKDRDELLEHYNKIVSDLALQDDSQLELKELEKRLENAKIKYLDYAQELSQKRDELNKIYGDNIANSMEQLGIKGGKLFFSVKQKDEFSESGIDSVEILAKTNIGEDLAPIAQIASGGELSRILLILKEYARKSVDMMIFDEVDTGIGGETATKLANHLEKLSQKYQLIIITHLQQIAAKGDIHFSVSKYDDNKRTYVKVNRLNSQERILEIARMIGDSSDEKVIATAQKLLSIR